DDYCFCGTQGPVSPPAREDHPTSGCGLPLSQRRLRNRNHLLRHVALSLLPAFCSARHSTNRLRPSSKPILASKPSSFRALSVEARRRGTALTFRSGPNSTGKSESMTLSSVAASCFKLVSVPLATLNTLSEMSACAANTLHRAMSSPYISIRGP